MQKMVMNEEELKNFLKAGRYLVMWKEICQSITSSETWGITLSASLYFFKFSMIPIYCFYNWNKSLNHQDTRITKAVTLIEYLLHIPCAECCKHVISLNRTLQKEITIHILEMREPSNRTCWSIFYC